MKFDNKKNSYIDSLNYNCTSILVMNTFDGAKMDLQYTPENIKRITKECAENFIGALALANAGVINLTNEYPYIISDGTLLSNIEFYNKVKMNIDYKQVNKSI